MSLLTNDFEDFSQDTPHHYSPSPFRSEEKGSKSTSTSTWTSSLVLLRPNLILFEDNCWIYHIAIVLDLVLRFFFVISFLPTHKLEELLGSELPLYLGCFEILRRAMWMTLRLEWEHIKFVALCNTRKQEMTTAMMPMTAIDSPATATDATATATIVKNILHKQN